jgi:Domain of unknown function (DUF6458)
MKIDRAQAGLVGPLGNQPERAELRSGQARIPIRWISRSADYDSPVGIGMSIFLIAVGAILRYAVTVTVSGIELQTVGLILMIVGIIGLVISLAVIFTAGQGGGGRRGPDEYPTRRYD